MRGLGGPGPPGRGEVDTGVKTEGKRKLREKRERRKLRRKVREKREKTEREKREN